MRTLSALGTNPAYLARYQAIRDRKHHATRDPLLAAHGMIQQRYQALDTALAQGTLDTLQQHEPALALAKQLRACYDVSTEPLRNLKDAIRTVQPTRLLKYCPMCGTTLPRTFDHYFPAVRFPEFAVHPLNLVPCCSTCNSTKDDDWLTAAGKRQYLHAYTDAVPAAQYLQVTLHEHPALIGVGATFSLQRPPQVPNAQWDLLESHFDRLHLLDRYNERGNDEVSEILADCKLYLETGGPDVGQFLSARASDRRDVYGSNHWIAVLMAALAGHPRLLAWTNAAT